MSVYRKKWESFIDADLDAVWDFFSRPENLNKITPPEMNFEILNDIDGRKMYPGMIIQYRVRPLLNIPTTWVTEITEIEEKKYFIDDQRVGPYKMWHHEHHFEKRGRGVLMTDLLHYSLPAEPLGSMFMGRFISKKVDGIFEYRNQVLPKLFPSKEG